MIPGRRVPDAVQWHEGMLLAPQHFQLAATRAEELVHYHVRAASPFHWGVRRVVFDDSLLVGGTLRVTELEAVMPDGLLVVHGPDRGAPLEVDLGTYAEEARRAPLRVHLAVPARRREGEPFAGSLARHESVEGREVADENTGEGAMPVPRLRPRVSLLVTQTPPDKYVSFPLARVSFNDETFARTDFVPPQLGVAHASGLGDACARLATRVREKAVYLCDKVRANASGTRSASVADMQQAVAAMTAELPRLEALLATGVSHPLELYLALCSLAGRLGPLAMQVPPQFRAYDHDDLRATFAPVLEFCGRMLDAVQETYTATPFHFDDGAFGLALRPEWMARTLVVGVVPQAGMSEAEAAAWFEETRIASRGRMQSVRERRIRGAERKRIDTVGDLGLVGGKGTVLFAIRVEPELIEAEDVLQVAHPAEHTGRARPREMLLYTRSRM
ncbi:MAG: type VI secretion system baseplate subunit TssK [Gemmatimonadota bacterium]